jgi:DNA-directed RNA polymerase beta subunit
MLKTCLDRTMSSFMKVDPHAHHVESYLFLLHTNLQNIILTYGKFTTMLDKKRYRFEITNVRAVPVNGLTPAQCYAEGTNFVLSIVGLFLLYQEEDSGQWVQRQSCDLVIANLPAMTMDNLPGEKIAGIFICKGKSRTIPMTKTIATNMPIFRRNGRLLECQVRSEHADKAYRSTSTIELLFDTATCLFAIRLPFQTTPIPMGVILQALGTDATTICTMVTGFAKLIKDPMILCRYKTGLASPFSGTRHDAILTISRLYGKTIRSTGENIIHNEVLPHLRQAGETPVHNAASRAQKVLTFAMYIAQLIQIDRNLSPIISRDVYAKTRIVTCADHLGSLFRLLFIVHIRTCGKLLRRTIMTNADVGAICITKIFGEHRLSQRLSSAVASGSWSMLRKGVSIPLNNNNEDSIMAQLRRISSSLVTTDGAHASQRNIQADQYGFICAASTPDGETTGLVYEMAVTCSISPPSTLAVQQETDTIVQQALPFLDPFVSSPNSIVCIGTMGTILGGVGLGDLALVITTIRGLRRKRILPQLLAISYLPDIGALQLHLQSGMLYRPLVVATTIGAFETWMRAHDNRELRWEELLASGFIEYISALEQSSLCTIGFATRPLERATTHLEIIEASFLGRVAVMEPFVTGQQGPRLAYYIAQKRQIITPGNKTYRGAPISTRAWNAFVPLVCSKATKMVPDYVSRGMPVTIAFMALPDNQEDAIIFKKSTLDRGAFAASTIRTYVSEIANTTSENFERPVNATDSQQANYQFLGINGIPAVGTFVPGGAVVIGKVRAVKRTCPDNRGNGTVVDIRDISTASRHDEGGTITKSMIQTLSAGTRAQVDLSTSRPPIVGDKFTSKYAQKGVIGAIWKDEDLPFSSTTGTSPDIIVSPLSQVSRMTMSSMIEALTGKAVALSGDLAHGIDQQWYTEGYTEHIRNMETLLEQHGFRPDGTECFIDGRTGQMIPTRIFIGCIEMFRLVHLAAKKLHARSIGPRDPLTRQPRDGRKFGGGLRIGEMESNALAAHGCSKVLQERFRELSDAFEVSICERCGTLVDEANGEVQYYFCRTCQDTNSSLLVQLPFTFLVMILELLSMGIVVRFDVHPSL